MYKKEKMIMLTGILVCIASVALTVGALFYTVIQDKKDHVNGW